MDCPRMLRRVRIPGAEMHARPRNAPPRVDDLLRSLRRDEEYEPVVDQAPVTAEELRSEEEGTTRVQSIRVAQSLERQGRPDVHIRIKHRNERARRIRQGATQYLDLPPRNEAALPRPVITSM